MSTDTINLDTAFELTQNDIFVMNNQSLPLNLRVEALTRLLKNNSDDFTLGEFLLQHTPSKIRVYICNINHLNFVNDVIETDNVEHLFWPYNIAWDFWDLLNFLSKNNKIKKVKG